MELSQSRRDFLKGSTAVSAVVLSGCMAFDGGASMGKGSPLNAGANINTEVPTAIDPAAYEDRFSEVVDITEEPYNADPTGEEPIDEALMMAWEDDRLIVFPQGQYKMNQGFRRTGWQDVGLVGQNAVIRHGDVEVIHGHRVEEGEFRGGTMLFELGTMSSPHRGELVFGGFIFDWDRENAGMQGLYAMVDSRAEIRNIAFNGVHDLGTHGNMRVATTSPSAVAIVDSVSMTGGGMHYHDTINTRQTRNYDGSVSDEGFGQSWSTTGVTGHPEMEGTVVLQNVLCGPWPDNGLYIQGGGRQIVKNCIVSNSGTSNIRFNGTDDWEPVPEIDGTEDGEVTRDGPYSQSTVEGCVILIDRLPRGVYNDQRGIWHYDGEGTIRDCEVTIAHESESSGAGGNFAIGTRSGVTESVVDGCQISLLEPADAFYFGTVSPVTVQDVSIETEGWDAGSTPADVIGGRMPSLENVTLNGSS